MVIYDNSTCMFDDSRCGVKDVIGKVSGSRGKRYALQGELCFFVSLASEVVQDPFSIDPSLHQRLEFQRQNLQSGSFEILNPEDT